MMSCSSAVDARM